jgi:hypothetical protein
MHACMHATLQQCLRARALHSGVDRHGDAYNTYHAHNMLCPSLALYTFTGNTEAVQTQPSMTAMMQMMMHMQTSSQQAPPQRSQGLKAFDRLETEPQAKQAQTEPVALEDAKPQSSTVAATEEQPNRDGDSAVPSVATRF